MVQPLALEIPAAGPGSATGELIRISWTVRVRVKIVDSADAVDARDVVMLSRAGDLASVEQGQSHHEDRSCALLTFQDLTSRRLVPGVPISGVLTVSPRRPVSARGLRVELVLREEVDHGPWIGDDPARNPSDQGREKDTVLFSAPLTNRLELDPARPQRLPFAVTVPARLAAPSLRTPEFSASWILRGVLDRALHQDPYVEVELLGVTAPS
jgi:hypothetical protein